jgi:hypothetical protein
VTWADTGTAPAGSSRPHAALAGRRGRRQASRPRVLTRRFRSRRPTQRTPRGGSPHEPADGAVAQSLSRPRGGSRSGARLPAGNELGSSPGRPRPAWPRSGSSSDAWRSPRRSRPDARTGPACSVTSLGKSKTAGSTTVTCSPSRSRSTPSTRCSVAESAPAGASSRRRHGHIDRGDVHCDGGDRGRATSPPRRVRAKPPAAGVSQAKTPSCQASAVTKRPKLAPFPKDVPPRPSASGRR